LDWDNVFVRLFNDSRQRLARLEARRGANWTKDADALLRTFRTLFRTAAKLGARAKLVNDEGEHVLSLSQVSDELGADWTMDKSFSRTGGFKQKDPPGKLGPAFRGNPSPGPQERERWATRSLREQQTPSKQQKLLPSSSTPSLPKVATASGTSWRPIKEPHKPDLGMQGLAEMRQTL